MCHRRVDVQLQGEIINFVFEIFVKILCVVYICMYVCRHARTHIRTDTRTYLILTHASIQI